MAFMELGKPRDMLDKLKREHTRLSSEWHIDNVFNFFVTAYHVRDYIDKTNAVPKAKVDEFFSDQDMKDCRDLCDKAKHLRLTHRPDPATHRWSGAMGGAPFNTVPINGQGRWQLRSDDREIDIAALADRVVLKLDRFFVDNGL